MPYVFGFSEGDGGNKDLMGGKGAGLAEMTRLGLHVPPGFTATTDACRMVMREGAPPPTLWSEVEQAVRRLEQKVERTFGGGRAPLLLSVRSGAKFSMPGMMDTVLNLGLNDTVVKDLIDWSGEEHFAWDAYRRFVQMYSKVVLGVASEPFEKVLAEMREQNGVAGDSELSATDLEDATRRFQEIVAGSGKGPIPDDPHDQLRAAISAVFGSWNNRRARDYRRIHGIPDDLGTAANVQMMVFGDFGDDSGTGVCFTRDPSTGERRPFGDYLPRAPAAVRIAVEMVAEGLIDRREAVMRVEPSSLEQLERPRLDPKKTPSSLVKGVAASPGAAAGAAVFDADRAVTRREGGEAVILFRPETTPDDIHGMAAAAGILTSRGGKTSHAAVVARGMGKPAVTGASELSVDLSSRTAAAADTVVQEGDEITIDGTCN